MKRFYKAATATGSGREWQITLDGRPVKTPARAPLVVPTRPLADVIVTEWDAQQEEIDPATMPMTGLSNAAIDHVAPGREAFVDGLAAYAESDLVCYRAESPADLADRHAAAWDPLIHWAGRRYDVALRTTCGIIHQPQDRGAVDRLRAVLEEMDDFTLAAMQPLVTIAGSLVIALAVAEGEIDAQAGWSAGQLDELYQAEKWGEDAEAMAGRAARRAAFDAAARFLTLLRRRSG